MLEAQVANARSRDSVGLVHELATLIESGLSPTRAWQLLAEPLAKIDGQVAKQLELSWALANKLGAPIVVTLRQLAENSDVVTEQHRAQALAFATPKLTASLMAWLPLVALVLAQFLGLNPIGTILSNFVAMLAVVLGFGVMAVGHLWSKRLVERAAPDQSDPAQFVDAVSVAMLAGLPINRAIAEASVLFAEVSGEMPPEKALAQVQLTADFSNQTGAAAVVILTALAKQLRRDQAQLANEKISQLSIRLLLPIGVAILPAFALLTVVPIALGFLQSAI